MAVAHLLKVELYAGLEGVDRLRLLPVKLPHGSLLPREVYGHLLRPPLRALVPRRSLLEVVAPLVVLFVLMNERRLSALILPGRLGLRP